ncbi:MULTISPECIES: DUF1294 domain-containing protein [Shouchella]|uniref:DUF1294 domain-containing protein n=2 Tax=Shouchella TaxID=2893057 RepID=A0ABY7W7W2_9BACI|nr:MULTISPECIES: DUF1294 domain-containing protein [Shouchella]MED4129209.1 DUF1294 domain-containing protein [Shouchella miscanthi]WDF04171.1 DUF1294 domain-containing protein [Shouchella hunanensis]GAF23771.1 hypothetical protein JCM19047_3614 [Bacillus sp. JCM 19047]
MLVYLSLLSVFTFIVMGMDKHNARHQKSRIPEKSLFLLAIVGGSVGLLAGMYSFRHKTRKPSFKYGIPALVVLQLAVGLFIYTSL